LAQFWRRINVQERRQMNDSIHTLHCGLHRRRIGNIANLFMEN
jgi:hypothetical protein